jgi:hypothetical protein
MAIITGEAGFWVLFALPVTDLGLLPISVLDLAIGGMGASVCWPARSRRRCHRSRSWSSNGSAGADQPADR